MIRLRVDLTHAQLLAEMLLASNKRKRTSDLCDIGAVLYQLSIAGNWELVTWWVRNIAVDGEGWIYERSYYFECGERYEKINDHRSVVHTTSTAVKLKNAKHLGMSEIWAHDLCDTGAEAKLVEHCTGIAEVMGSTLAQAWILFIILLHNCLSFVYYCDDHWCLHVFLRSSNIWSSIYSLACIIKLNLRNTTTG